MKQNIIFLTAVTVALFLATSCSLNKNPLDTYSDVTQGVSDDTTQSALKDKAAVLSQYQVLHDALRRGDDGDADHSKNGQEAWYLYTLLLAEVHSDNAYAGNPSQETTPFEVNSIEGSNVNLGRMWPFYMDKVAQANRLICNIDKVNDPTLTDAERARYKAEGLIFRAMVYFDMVRIWGNVPLITTEAVDITAENVEEVYPVYFPPQTTSLEVYKQIERDLLDALPDAPANNAGDKTIFSKSLARTLLAKVYAEKTLRDYNLSLQYCEEVEADGFNLVEDFNDLFGVQLTDPTAPPSETNPAIEIKMRNTVESIYEAQFTTGDGNWVAWVLSRKLDEWNFNFDFAKWICPSRDIIKAFTDAGDTKRYTESIVYYDVPWQIYYPKENYPHTYKCRSAFNSIIKYRFADVLLMKAEALIMLGRESEALPILNRIRQRAGLQDLPASALSGTETAIKTYLAERRLELAFEGSRWFDLVRLDKVEEVMNSINSRDAGRPALVYPYDEFSYILPIPQTVLDQNQNLVQNPGY
ncbi:MAG: RagB/SusD family nutrient uptake outer membrane protein [Bacteroidales bacterium]|nr:RagB/SusD family nutrient uptake outer membrane protein [Bacteroidales bacterium]